MLYVVTGVRGAGKTTLIDNVAKDRIGFVLQPSTTRPPRFVGEAEYDFVHQWDAEKYAWVIEHGGHMYGMRISEIERSCEIHAFTVFEPLSIETFYRYRQATDLQALVIGLDTVCDLEVQHLRVKTSPSRMMTAEQFEGAREMIRGTDICIHGSENEILSQIRELVRRNTKPVA